MISKSNKKDRDEITASRLPGVRQSGQDKPEAVRPGRQKRDDVVQVFYKDGGS